MRHGGGKCSVLAVGEVDAIAGAQHGLLGQPQCRSHARRNGRAVGKNQRGRQLTADGGRGAGLHLRNRGKPAGCIRIHKGHVAVLLCIGREVLVAQTVVQGEIGSRAPVVCHVSVPHVFTQVALARGGVDGGLLRFAQQKIRQRGAGIKAGEVKGAGGVRPAQKIAVHAAIVAAKAQIVLAVNPAQHLGSRDGLRERKAGLLLAQSGEAAERHIGQAVVERARVQRNTARSQNA